MLVALKPTQETINIVASLTGHWHGSYALCICPAYDDKTAPLSVRQGKMIILVHCFAGCKSEDILREIGRTRPILNTPVLGYRPEGLAPNITRIWNQGAKIHGTLGEANL